MVHAAYQSHLGQDYFFAPRAKLADGIIWLIIVKAGISRANLLQVNSPIKTNTSGSLIHCQQNATFPPEYGITCYLILAKWLFHNHIHLKF